jgi:alkylation response protein AidB-like acyl-CoA dehydrogenase
MAAGAILKNLHVDDDFVLLAKAVGEFGDRELAPYLRELGKEEFPARFIPLAGSRGFLGTAIPAEFGGQGGTLEGLLSVLEGIAACDGSLALTLAAHESLATTHILVGGNDEQKRKYLPELTAGRKIGAWCLTEPQAGSNIFNDTRTKLVQIADGWKLSGEKTFITNGCHADLFVVLARTFFADGKDAGMTACVVESDKGTRITATPLHEKMGMCRSDTASLRFDAVPVAGDAILGLIGSGDKSARRVLLRGRIAIGALALGLARDSLERAVAYAKERKLEVGSLFDQALTRAKFSQMEASLWVAWQALRSAAQCADRSKPFKVQACMAKVFATEAALRITDEAVQILGGYGYMRDYKVEQNYRDARLLTIGEGASEILRLAIARNLVGANLAGEADVLTPLESLRHAAGHGGSSMDTLWGPGWQALGLAYDSVRVVRAQLEEEGRRADSGQCPEAAFADLATQLWAAIQAILAGTVLFNRGNAPETQIQLVRAFLVGASIDLCHQASKFFCKLGLTEAKLHNNYVEALRLGVRIHDPGPPALPGQEES